MSELFINKKIWNTFTIDEMNIYQEKVYKHYRENGFPYFKLTDKEIAKELFKLKNLDSSTLIDGENIKQIMLGLNVVNYYMPHLFHVKSNGFKSPFDAYCDDDLFKKAIAKRISFGDNISDAGIRKVLSWVTGTQKVSNFRPTVAKAIYDLYSKGNVLDYSSGFGGRLLGAIASDKVTSYTGFDPSTKTYDGLCKIKELTDKSIYLHNIPFEDSNLDQVYDLSFSSPPYFNTEEYSYEETQSFMRYKTKSEWREGFLEKVISLNYDYLKPDGLFIINVADVKTYKNLEEETVDICFKMGFKHVRTYNMALSKLMSSGFKYEPIFIFRK